MVNHEELTHLTSVGGPQGLVGPWSNSGIKAKKIDTQSGFQSAAKGEWLLMMFSLGIVGLPPL